MNRPYLDRPMRFLFALFCCAALTITITPAAADTIKTLSIEGHVYELVLTENTELTSRLKFRQDRELSGAHYRGHLKDHPDSWVRASLIEGNWQGVVSIGGESYILDAPSEASTASQLRAAEARISDLSATAVSSFEPRACGVKPASSLMSAAAHVAEPDSALLVAKEVAFSSLCSTTINGTCLIAELEVAFDLDFVNSFPNSGIAADQALALVNATEGFYLNDFAISFEALSLELLNNNVSTTTNANALLTDVSDAKDSGTFGFLQNTRSLFHFVTGRDLDGGTAGIGFVNEICTTSAVGVSSLLDNFGGAPNIPLTAIVMAHELGHNFGADHDGDTNACSNGFIMEAAVNSSTTQFSSCSLDEITSAIEDVANPALCFNFPADAGITAAVNNPTEVASSEEFTASYTVRSSDSFQAIPILAINGSVPASQGRFTSVTLSGQSCNLGNQGQNYSCSLSSPAAITTLLVNSIATGTSLNLTHTTSLLGSNDIRDVDSSNDQVISAFTVVSGELPPAPSGLVAVQGEGTEVNLSWQDNSSNETSFIVERRLLGETFTQLTEVSVNITSFIDTTSTANNTYEYQVFTSNDNGSSALTAIAQVEVTPATVTPPPTSGGGTTRSSSGGGGSIHWSMLLCLAGLAWRRIQNSHRLAS